MNQKSLTVSLTGIALSAVLSLNTTPVTAQLTSVFKDNTYQITGVAVSKSGRMFVNYPYWTDTHKYAVVEVSPNGAAKPYPDAAWNSWKPGQNPANKWICVQAVFVDDKDRLWIVDPASPKQAGVYNDAHKVVCFNLTTNQPERTFSMAGVVGPDSYINDIRVDTKREVAYVTESQQGGIIVMDLKTGKSRLTLTGDKSVKSDPTYEFLIDNRQLKNAEGPVKFNSDGLALTPDGEVLYYKPLTDNKLYRIRTEYLRDPKIADKELGGKVEDLGKFTSTDGMIIDGAGYLYMGDVQNYQLYRLHTPDMKREDLVTDREKLMWPDSYAIHDGYLYITTSHIQHMAKNNDGKSTRKTPYEVLKLKIGQ